MKFKLVRCEYWAKLSKTIQCLFSQQLIRTPLTEGCFLSPSSGGLWKSITYLHSGAGRAVSHIMGPCLFSQAGTFWLHVSGPPTWIHQTAGLHHSISNPVDVMREFLPSLEPCVGILLRWLYEWWSLGRIIRLSGHCHFEAMQRLHFYVPRCENNENNQWFANCWNRDK